MDSKAETEETAPTQARDLTESTTSPVSAQEPNQKNLLRFRERIISVGPYAFLLAIFTLGMTLSSIVWSASVNNLQIDLRRAQEELSLLKLDNARKAASPALNNGQDQSPSSDKAEQSIDAKQANVKIVTGTTVSLFEGLSISLVGTEFKTDPSRYQAKASVSSPGQPEMKINNADVGYITEYPASTGYVIQILAIDNFSAKFLVKRQ